MQPQHSSSPLSFQYGDSPAVFTEMFSESTTLSCWQRPKNTVIQAYLTGAMSRLQLGIRNVFHVETLKSSLNDTLPEGIGKEQTINDIYLLADMLTCLFDCQEVGLRLSAVNQAMCPRFHVDKIPLRLITTYIGAGTQWIPNEYADMNKVGHSANSAADLGASEQRIEQLQCFDVALLKGTTWGEEHSAVIHRSCAPEENQWRVLLSLDPM